MVFAQFINLNLIQDIHTFNIIFTTILSCLFFVLFLITFYRILNIQIKIKSAKFSNSIKALANLFTPYFKDPLIRIDKSTNSFLTSKLKIKRIAYVNKFLRLMYYVILKPSNFDGYNKVFILYYILKHVPKIISVFVFFIEIFIYQRLYLFYWTLPFLLMPLVLEYVKYNIFYEYHYFYNLLETNIKFFDTTRQSSSDDLMPSVNVSRYLEYFLECQLNNKPNLIYTKFYLSLAFYYNLTKEQIRKLDVSKMEENYLRILCWVEIVYVIYHLWNEKDTFYKNYSNLFVYALYCITWTYITVILLFN